jgi:ferredoxin-NADP reductase
MAMVRDFARKGWPAKVTLVYGAKNLDDAIFHRELTKLSSRNERFSYTLILSEPAGEWVGKTGFITGSRILEAAGGIENRTFFICGPQAMYDFCIPELKRIKAPRHRIRRELYGPPSPITSSPGWPVTIPAEKRFSVSVDGRRTFDAAAGEPLLNSLEREGIAAPALCRSGECSNCRVKLLSGRVYQPPQALVRQSDRECGYIHTCVAYPVSDLVIRI